jgi:exopolysaccharide production protein ExoZ
MSGEMMLQTLQVGRGIAAISVVAFHLSINYADDRYLGRPLLEKFTWWGEHGVDFFFVLSGFIIMHAHHADLGQRGRWFLFIRKRFVRIYPPYLLFTAGVCILLTLGLGTSKTIPDNTSDWFEMLSLVRVDAYQPLLPPAWTLYHEVAFYAVFSTLIINQRFGTAALVIWIAAGMVNFQYSGGDQMTALNTYLSPLNADFAIGIGSYHLWKQGSDKLCVLALALGLVMLALALTIDASKLAPMAVPLLYATAFGGIVAGAARLETNAPVQTIPVLSFLGAASYSIYLTHELIQSVLLKLMMKIGLIEAGYLNTSFALNIVATVALGCLAYLVVEKPLLDIARKLLPQHKTPAYDTVAKDERNTLQPYANQDGNVRAL